MSKKILLYAVLSASIILLLLHILALDFQNLGENSYYGIIGNVLIAISMLFNLRSLNKNKEIENTKEAS